MVVAIVSLEYFVFMTEHWLPEIQQSGWFIGLLRLFEVALFHFVVGCLLVAYYKVVFTGTYDGSFITEG